MSGWQLMRGIKVKPGQYVECVKLGRINKLSLGKRYQVLEKPSKWYRHEWDKPQIRVYLKCDDGIVRSFNTWNFKICEDQL